MTEPSLPLPLPEIASAERTPLVEALLGIIGQQQEHLRRQAERIAQLEEAIRRLTGGPGRPQLKPSRLEQEPPAGDEFHVMSPSTRMMPHCRQSGRRVPAVGDTSC